MEHKPRRVTHDSDLLLRRPREGSQTHGGHPHGASHQSSHAEKVILIINNHLAGMFLRLY